MGTLDHFRDALNPFSGALALFIAGNLVPPLAIALVLLGLPAVLAGALGVLGGAAAFVALVPRLPSEWSELMRSRPRWVSSLWIVACLASFLFTLRLPVFMLDGHRTEFSLAPPVEFMVEHNCLSGYVSAAQLAQSEPESIYVTTRYASSSADDLLLEISPQKRDVYSYPPPFLLLPRTMLALTNDFRSIRAGWYAVYVCTVLGALFWFAMAIGGRPGAIFATLIPVVWLSLPILVTLQLGNLHLFNYALAISAMFLFERGRNGLGGAMLAFAVVSKVSPGILGIYLLVQRRWVPALWTAAFGALYVALTFAVFGAGPFQAFLGGEVLQKLGAGTFYPRLFAWEPAILVNYSLFAVPLKLELLGMSFGEGFGVGRLLNNLYLAGVVGLVVWTAHRMHSARPSSWEASAAFRARTFTTWLAALSMGSFVSPFAPWTYGAVGPVLVFASFAAWLEPKSRSLAILAACWFAVSIYGPPKPMPMVFVTLTAMAVIYVSHVLILLSAGRTAADAPEINPA
ncbi:MAG: DUF2029 domain-containing protein [Myxococcales bacterium]|nr:DUF2029 domain-containing protein [Myxococcales bacterium]